VVRVRAICRPLSSLSSQPRRKIKSILIDVAHSLLKPGLRHGYQQHSVFRVGGGMVCNA
jgi:hypothetical protein